MGLVRTPSLLHIFANFLTNSSIILDNFWLSIMNFMAQCDDSSNQCWSSNAALWLNQEAIYLSKICLGENIKLKLLS